MMKVIFSQKLDIEPKEWFRISSNEVADYFLASGARKREKAE